MRLWVQDIKTVCVVYDKDNKEIVMFYTADSELNIGEFKKELMRSLPKYMIPGKYLQLDELPMNTNGKIDRLKLNRQVNDGIV